LRAGLDGGRTITRFGLVPGEDGWRAAIARHWYLDADDPAEALKLARARIARFCVDML
jgi:hypothetical protein